jgi:hypothetical protein
MAKVTWEVGKPQPNPFEAVAGDFREYVVHLCTASGAGETEIPGIFVEFFRQVFEAALEVENAEARKVLIEVDTVYAMITVVVTDDVRSHDEREVFKLTMDDWDARDAGDEEVDEEAEQASFQRVMENFEGAICGALGDSSLLSIQAELRARRYRLWIFDQDEEEAGETLEELPLAGV